MSCLETYATLRIFSDSINPEAIGIALGLDGTVLRSMDKESKYRHERDSHFWGWCSKSAVQSTDGIEHVSAILDRLAKKSTDLDSLRARGCEIDISCYWVTDGQGGPGLRVEELTSLAELRLPIWWDVYFGERSDYVADAT